MKISVLYLRGDLYEQITVHYFLFTVFAIILLQSLGLERMLSFEWAVAE